jgi:hypothetical protein
VRPIEPNIRDPPVLCNATAVEVRLTDLEHRLIVTVQRGLQ